MADTIQALIQSADGTWLAFADPALVVHADTAGDVGAVLTDVERLTRERGYHAVGFVTYEAAAAFGLAVRPAPAGLPLVWFALFEPSRVRPVNEPASGGSYQIDGLVPSLDRAAFADAFHRIKEYLAAGDTYQVNFTFKLTGAFAGDAQALFVDLVAAQQGAYSAFLTSGAWSICSASPELFFAVEGTTIQARPMKGTVRRGPRDLDDAVQREHLRTSAKQQAENVMIVDMIRNDLGRIADVGSVRVPALFEVERYPNVWQMTSLVTARTTAPLADIFAALHPSASVTGAPKVSTMGIVRSLEPDPRGVYTGAIGHVAPSGDVRFNVAIRTAVVDHRRGRIEFGTGSGIVWDSELSAEYDECLLKSSVLGKRPPVFDLLETIRWTPGDGFFLLERHLTRIRRAAEYFGFRCDESAIAAALEAAVRGKDQPRRVRLLLARRGTVRVEEMLLAPATAPLRVALATAPVDASDPFLFHKTTNRAVYESARVAGFDEVLLWNGDGEVTEAITANIVAELDGRRVTPPVRCGLLAGTFREELLVRQEIEEAVIRVEDLPRADRLWLVNSVYEWRPAVFSS